METRPTVVLLTGSYPYSLANEETFLSPELPYLRREFGRVLLVPAVRGGELIPLPKGIEVDESLAIYLAARPGRPKTLWDALVCPVMGREVSHRLPVLRSSAALRRLVAFAAAARRVSKWQGPFAARQGLRADSTVLYTYWLDALTAGLVLARAHEPSLVVVSRAHRFDVYEEDLIPPYLPGQRWLLQHLDRVFLVSEAGRSYLVSRHPRAEQRLIVSRLGTPEPGFLSEPSADGVLRVVSCSSLTAVKQVDVLAQGLKMAARARPDRPIEWHHFGDGPMRAPIEALMRGSAPNLSWRLWGYVANAEVLRRYRSRPTDLFANTSRSEGIPVSIMEAQSCGIPSMAPDVGGVREIVAADSGLLLLSPVTANAVADAILSILAAPRDLLSQRARSRRNWEDRFDASRNFASFSHALSALRARPSGASS